VKTTTRCGATIDQDGVHGACNRPLDTDGHCDRAGTHLDLDLDNLDNPAPLEDEDEAVEEFKRAWHHADARGETGSRVRAGLRAVNEMFHNTDEAEAEDAAADEVIVAHLWNTQTPAPCVVAGALVTPVDGITLGAIHQTLLEFVDQGVHPGYIDWVLRNQIVWP